MNPNDKKILEKAISTLPSTQKVVARKVLEGGTSKEAEFHLSEAMKRAHLFGQSLAGRPDLVLTLGRSLKLNPSPELKKILAELFDGYNQGQRALDYLYREEPDFEWSPELSVDKLNDPSYRDLM